jgi:phenylacetate-CoA ligase
MESRKLVPTDIKSVRDLVKLPVLTKNDLRTHGRDLLADNIGTMKISWAKTGGTTGEPIRVARNIECVAMSAICYSRGLAWGGLDPDAPRVRLFGGSLGIDTERFSRKIGTFLRGELLIPAFELRRDTAPLYFERIRRSRARFIIGYASALFRLATLARENNENVELKAVFPTAELMMPDWEDAIRRAFKCDVLPYYGCGEVHSLGFSKPGSGCYLIPEEHASIEIMEKDGGASLDGEGRFLLTDLDNYAMPILRYLNGDAGQVMGPNGTSPFARIDRLDGRYNSLLMTDTGDLISGVLGTHVFRSTASVQSYRIIQEEPLRVVIQVLPKSTLSEDDRQLILTLFAKYLGKNMKITIEEVPSLPIPPSGKAVFVINHCVV